MSADSICVTTLVAAEPTTAFALFTAEVDAWWKRGRRFRPSLRGADVLHFEPGIGGRLLETYDDDSTFEFGRIKVWEPGRRLVFDLFGRDFRPGESTEVEVRFAAEGRSTRVTVEHRGWEQFPEDHPARHGFGDPAFVDVMSVWFVSIQAHISATSE